MSTDLDPQEVASMLRQIEAELDSLDEESSDNSLVPLCVDIQLEPLRPRRNVAEFIGPTYSQSTNLKVAHDSHLKTKNCKKCGITVGVIVTAETTQQIRVICQGVGAVDGVLDAMMVLYAPLCRKCMRNWGTGEDDLVPPMAPLHAG